LKDKSNWEKRRFTAYKDAVQEKGHELWIERFDHAWLQNRKKEIGSFAFASEFMNNPISNEFAAIKTHQIREWEELPKQYSCVISIDPAYSDDERADFKAASLVGIDQNANRYLISYIRTHRPTGEFIDAILNMFQENRDTCTAVGCPKGAGDTEFFNSLRQKAEARKIFPPFVELKNRFTTSSNVTVVRKRDRIIAAL
jgi:hypothetical protein